MKTQLFLEKKNYKNEPMSKIHNTYNKERKQKSIFYIISDQHFKTNCLENILLPPPPL